jgi:archaeosine-15-forming tRNA-guanine transglycosylase
VVVSAGDILLIVGVAVVIAAGMRTIRRGSAVEQPAH